uniref:Uncharacterized protein n=1 Tax=Anguilla anguilla TaxID=7936 RepID=A0A0E9TBV4_ANGAN
MKAWYGRNINTIVGLKLQFRSIISSVRVLFFHSFYSLTALCAIVLVTLRTYKVQFPHSVTGLLAELVAPPSSDSTIYQH